jgi:hypothetical protein
MHGCPKGVCLGVLCPDLTQCGWASTMRLKGMQLRLVSRSSRHSLATPIGSSDYPPSTVWHPTNPHHRVVTGKIIASATALGLRVSYLRPNLT